MKTETKILILKLLLEFYIAAIVTLIFVLHSGRCS